MEPTAAHPWRDPQGTPTLRAHEFHYSSIAGLPADTTYAYAVRRGHGIDGRHDGIVHKNLLASYTHLRATAGCDWPARFVAFARAVRGDARPKENPPCSK
jgi:cobyrinic acid a,c-diamide synthase